MTVTVLLADDHALTLRGMQYALDTMEGFTVVATSTSGVEAVALAKAHQPDVAILDFAMPDMTGLEAIAEIRRWSPGTRCMVVTGSTTPATLRQLASAEIDGVFLKNSDVDEICAGVAEVARGGTVRGAGLPDPGPSAAPALSDREIEVLYGIVRGQSNPQIAENLAISPKTVESHRSSLMKKLDVHSTASLLITAMREGLIDL